MAWSGSAIFQLSIINPICHGVSAVTGFPATYGGLTYDAVNCALFNNTGTPNKADTNANIGYNTGQWTAASNEIPGTGNYTQGGVVLGARTWVIDTGSSSICFTDATSPTWTSATIANAYGCLIYDNTITSGATVAKAGMCYNYFGGAQSVTSGTFTVIWATVGALTSQVIFNITV